MEKLHRSQNDHIYTTTFVPEHALSNKEPNALDPFLEPLIEELQELFINGKFAFEAYNLYYTLFECKKINSNESYTKIPCTSFTNQSKRKDYLTPKLDTERQYWKT